MEMCQNSKLEVSFVVYFRPLRTRSAPLNLDLDPSLPEPSIQPPLPIPSFVENGGNESNN